MCFFLFFKIILDVAYNLIKQGVEKKGGWGRARARKVESASTKK
jgi:hypothetical protein